MSERGEALIETVLIAPILLLIGLFATEYGASALSRSQLSEGIRSTVNLELLNAENLNEIDNGHRLKIEIEKNLEALSLIDATKPLEVKVSFPPRSVELETKLPFLADQEQNVPVARPKELKVDVRGYGKKVFGNLLSMAPLEESVVYTLRGD